MKPRPTEASRKSPTPPPKERRTPGDRRAGSDRREMPPRPEGRRASGGRRQGDPEEV